MEFLLRKTPLCARLRIFALWFRLLFDYLYSQALMGDDRFDYTTPNLDCPPAIPVTPAPCHPETPQRLSVLIVDDHPVVRHGIRRMLADEYRNLQFSEARTAAEALAHIRKQSWDVVLLDISMPDGSGLTVLKDIRQQASRAGVLMLTMHPEHHYATRAFRAGASGYITKDAPAAEFLQAFRKVASGGRYVGPLVAEKLAANLEPPERRLHLDLSKREFSVLASLASGKRIREIAAELQLNVKTVSTYRRRLLKKMGMQTNAELTRYAVDHSLI